VGFAGEHTVPMNAEGSTSADPVSFAIAPPAHANLRLSRSCVVSLFLCSLSVCLSLGLSLGSET
jgi:hypothetical protein